MPWFRTASGLGISGHVLRDTTGRCKDACPQRQASDKPHRWYLGSHLKLHLFKFSAPLFIGFLTEDVCSYALMCPWASADMALVSTYSHRKPLAVNSSFESSVYPPSLVQFSLLSAGHVFRLQTHPLRFPDRPSRKLRGCFLWASLSPCSAYENLPSRGYRDCPGARNDYSSPSLRRCDFWQSVFSTALSSIFLATKPSASSMGTR
jgi:hypothetical protein